MSTDTSLPPLTPDEQAHSERLVHRIRDAIDAHHGWISFERFMEMALYEPGLGYYSAGSTKLGGAGDFVTAPEISSLFSRCLAAQCVEVLQRLGGGDVLELGAGSGVMAADILAELANQQCLPERYLILEVSADLRERQQKTLSARVPDLLPRVQWLDQWPVGLRGVIVANEVLDALPVQRFRIRGTQVNAVGVTWQLGQLDWSEVHADPTLELAVRAIERANGEPFPDGYLSEVNVRLVPWIAGLANALAEGVALFIDYGLPQREYYRSERREGTLLCHFRHRFHDHPLINVGVQDIGAWVDFTAVASAAHDAGMRVAGFATQAHFLIGCGIESFMATIAEQPVTERVQLARQVMVLTLPGEMGERFKVIGLAAKYDHPLRGFGVRDLSGSL
ncbi:SAM-dependent MidA family methyltransferase [Povalibacter uvarum]|uniref:SAM-dependent MidA family methyltransferase n=1 Tax=Povalibacter uvarum TaxID=732238 RepID=A0A841HWL6_9GAMM|nr:SAM-dependent methyltransferase [Povalibacter uvarum]MBB6096175.1 SAM-dependent MidA family methyltransferase [Povalibacter uvarum]